MSLFDRYRRASLVARSLLSAGAAACGTALFLGAMAGGISLATGAASAAPSEEETLASETGTSDPGAEAGEPPARSGAARPPGRGAKASATKVAQRRPATPDSDREDDE